MRAEGKSNYFIAPNNPYNKWSCWADCNSALWKMFQIFIEQMIYSNGLTVLADLSSPFSPASVIEFNPMSALQICLGLRCTHGMNVDEGWRLFWRPPTPAAAAAGLLSAQPAPPARCRLTLRPQLLGPLSTGWVSSPRFFDLSCSLWSCTSFFRFPSAPTLIDTASHRCEME